MSTIRFLGNHDVTAQGGKLLWEILTQLRGFGVGRMVTKNEWGRKWPEQPSFLLIRQVQPGMDRWFQKGHLWAEWTFRGRPLGVYKFSADLNRSDWRLIYRHEEASWKKCPNPMKGLTLPDTFPLPPLQKIYAKRMVESLQASGEHETAKTVDTDRAPLLLSIDPEFEHAPPASTSDSIYKEVDGAKLIDELYGRELPTRVDAWNIGPAQWPRLWADPFEPEEEQKRLSRVQ